MTATTIAYTLAGLIGAGIIFIGARFILAPRVAAAGYGVQPDLGQRSVGAYLSVKGVRDIASGLFVFILIAAGAAHLLGWVILAATVIPLADTARVLVRGGDKAIAFCFSCLTSLVMCGTPTLFPLS